MIDDGDLDHRSHSEMAIMDLFYFIYFFKKIYLFIHERHTERGRNTGRGRSRLHAGSPMWDSIPGFQDHTLSGKQMLNH